MIVDDNENLRITMTKILKTKGHEVISAADGEEALLLAEENKDIDLVFMDIKMPIMNGVETHKKLKVIIPGAVIIMMTAYAVDDLIQDALSDGAYGVLYKPLDLSSFDSLIGIIEDARKNAKGAMVLIVDDDTNLSDSFKRILETRGLTVMTAENGEKAIELAKTHFFDILFIDMKLPTINGLETYLTIKTAQPKTIAVMITGYPKDMRGLVDEAISSSAYSFLAKPLDMVKLFAVVDEILSSKMKKSK